jgi:aminoglycoside phosphotransferase (APT) family kinase protein
MTKDTSWRQRLKARKFNVPRAPKPTRDQIRAVIARHALDVSPDEVSPLPSIGTVNTVLALGERYVLRIPKPLGVGDTRTESVAAPVAKAAGLATPALLVYDDSQEVFDVPYTVYERIHGENFGLRNLDPGLSAKVYRDIGRQLAMLHQRVTECPDPHGYLDEPCRADPDDLLEYLGAGAYLSTYTIQWLSRVFEQLRPAVVEARRYRRFLHNDVLPTNVIVDRDEFVALIDWNDAGWGDPALEFVALPCRALPYALEGYREVSVIDGEETIAHRVLWDHLCLALEFLLTPPDKDNVSWARPPFARLTEIVAMAARYEPWQRLLGA